METYLERGVAKETAEAVGLDLGSCVAVHVHLLAETFKGADGERGRKANGPGTDGKAGTSPPRSSPARECTAQ